MLLEGIVLVLWYRARYRTILIVLDTTEYRPIPDAGIVFSLLLNHFRTEQGHCGACRRKLQLTDTDLCPCSETQTMSHIIESCPLTKLNGGFFRLHSADEGAVF